MVPVSLVRERTPSLSYPRSRYYNACMGNQSGFDAQRAMAVAVAAVRAASIVCRKVQANLVSAETIEKKDKSPVTVADFASQAIVCSRL